MKVAELCELLRVGDKHLYRMAARGSLPSFQVEGRSNSILKMLLNGFAQNTAWSSRTIGNHL
jgi:excisionase family DNA binding protein